MWDQVLKKINAQTTPLLAAKHWGKNIDKVNMINEGVNLVYCLEHENYKYYLRITHSELRPKEQLLAAILFQDYLFQHGVSVCEPIRSCNGEWIETIQQGKDCFLAHVCKEVLGQPIDFNWQNDGLYKQWGKTLGQFHKVALQYQVENFKYASWSTSFDEMNEYIKNEDKKVQSTLNEVSCYFKHRLKNKLNFGLTHGDHREGNVITNGKILNIIDFDLPCHNWLSEDLFRPFFDSIVNNNLSYKNKIIPYLDGYFQVMPQNSIELDSFSKHIQMKCLEIYLWTKNNWSNDSDAPGGKVKQEWLNKIHSKIIKNDWQKQLPVL